MGRLCVWGTVTERRSQEDGDFQESTIGKTEDVL